MSLTEPDKEFYFVNSIEITLSEFSTLELYDSLSKLDKYIVLRFEIFQTSKFWKILKNLKFLRNINIENYVNIDTFFGINCLLKEIPLLVLRLNDRDKFKEKNEDFREYYYENDKFKSRITPETKEFYLEKLDFFKTIGLNTTLSILSIEYIKLDKESLKLLQNFVINNSNLTELSLKKNEITSLEPFYDEMKETSKLKELKITENPDLLLNPNFLNFHKNLEVFTFRKNQNVDFFKFLHYVSKYSHYFLDYVDVDFSVKGISLKNYPFKSLDLKKYKVSLNSSQISNLLKECSLLNLKYINLEKQNSFNCKNAEILKDLLIQSKSLKNLKLNNLELNDQIFDIICDGIEKNTSLQKISLKNNPICQSYKKLNMVFKDKNIQKFMLSNLSFYDNINYNDYLRYMNNMICTLTTFGLLSKLKLLNCNLDDDSAYLLSKLIKETTYLKHLNLNQNVFGSKGIQLICKAMETNKTILKFKFGGTNFTKRGKYLFNFLEKNTILKYLNLENSDFTHDDILLMIKGLGYNKGIETFYFIIKERSQYSNLTDTYFEDYLYYNYSLKITNFGPSTFLDKIRQRNNRFIKTLAVKSNNQDISFKFN